MAAKRGFGVAGTLDHAIIGPLAAEVERLGYDSFWVNDVPKGDGLAALAVAAANTGRVRLAVGVIPVDRTPAERIIERVAELGLPRERLLVGIGSGGTKVGSIDLVRRNAVALREAGLEVAIAALGPNMVALTGQVANAVLFNWQTPIAAVDASARLAEAAGDRSVETIGYLRVGYGPGAKERLEEEAARYGAIPAYAAHFERLGIRAIDSCVQGDPAAIDRGLSAFDGTLDEAVARAITGEETLDAYLALARAAAP